MADEEEKKTKPVNFKTEKDFHTETEVMLEVIRDIKPDWKKRMEVLEKVQGVVVGNSSAKYPEAFDSFILKCVVPISCQILDLRSAIAKSACKTVELMAQNLTNAFDQAAERYLSANCLLKLILNGNKLLSETGHHTILVILQNIVSPKLLCRIADEMKSKNPLLRSKCGQYLHCILTHFPSTVLEKYTGTLEEIIKISVVDAVPDTRAAGRECFISYEEYFPAKAAVLFNSLSTSVQKAIGDTKILKSQPSAGKVVQRAKRTVEKSSDKKKAVMNEDMPKTMYNSWKEAKEISEKEEEAIARSTSSNRKSKENPVKEKIEIVQVTLKRVKAPQPEIPHIDSESNNEEDIEEDSPKDERGKWVGEEETQHTNLNQSGFVEQKGEEMASEVDDDNIDGEPEPEPEPEINQEEEKKQKIGIGPLIQQCESESWEKRHKAFEELSKLIQNDETTLEAGELLSILGALISHINDSHYKVAQSVLQAIGHAIVLYTKQVSNHLDELAPKVLFSMSDKREPVANISNFVYQLMHTNYGADKLMPSFVKCLEPNHIIRIKAGALEVMNMLIKESQAYFVQENNVKICVQKAMQLINDNFKNKKIVMPAIGVLLALRDINYDVTIGCILGAPDSQLTKVRTLAHNYAKDLEENMDRSVSNLPAKPVSKLFHSSKKEENEEIIIEQIPKITKQNVKLDNESNLAKEEKKEKNPVVQITTKKVFPTKSASPPPRPSLLQPNNEIQLITKMLSSEKGYTPKEAQKLLQLISKVLTLSITKATWDKLYAKIIQFLFSTAIMGSDTSLMEEGFNTINSLVETLHAYMLPHLGNFIDSLIKCYVLSRKVYDFVDKVMDTTISKFSAEKIILLIMAMIPDKKPPFLQAVYRGLSRTVTKISLSKLKPMLENIIKPSFIAINHENPDVRKSVVQCIVEIYAVMGEEFEHYLTELSASQIKLVKIYMQKKKEQK